METLIQIDRSVGNFEDLYVKKGVLGEGCFGCVFHCVNKKTKRECAVKLLPVGRSEEEYRRVQTEVSILASLDHPNIVRFQGAVQLGDAVCLEMELMRGGSLKAVLARRKLEEREAAALMHGVLQAVYYIHGKNIYHQDLKPENILLPEPDRFDCIKLTDFGLSAKFEGSDVVHKLTDLSGTVVFMAPEQGTRFFYSKSVDIWSCAMILYWALAGRHPLYEENDTVESYQEKLKNPVWEFPQEFSHLGRSLFLKMAAIEPIERYSAYQALRHPFISRSSTEIPRTCLEQMIEYADTAKLTKILFSLYFLSAIRKQGGLPVVAEEPQAEVKTIVRKQPSAPRLKHPLLIQKKSATVSHLQIQPRNSLETNKKESLTPGLMKPDSGKVKNLRYK